MEYACTIDAMNIRQDALRHLWLDRFAMKVGELLPSTTAHEAWAYAELIYEEACELAPDQAAEAFTAAIPPRALGAF